MKNRIFFLSMFAVPTLSFAQASNEPYFDVAQQQYCVDRMFQNQIHQLEPIDPLQQLTIEGIGKVSDAMDLSVKDTLILATNKTLELQGVVNSSGKINMAEYFDLFIDQLSIELPRHFHYTQCTNSDEYIYNVAVNIYLGSIIGKGNIYGWFVHNGGMYVSSAFIATLVGLKGSGREVDLDDWENFYKSYVKNKFSASNQ